MQRHSNSNSELHTALIYTRVSSDDQAREGVSLEAQLTECRRYVARNEWQIGHEYQDVMSGKRADRPSYQAMLAEIRRLRADGRAVVAVVAAIDRLGRNLGEQVRAREELAQLGLRVHSVRDGGEISDLTANILASVAQEESRRLGERVRASWQLFMAQGWYKTAAPAWGYIWRERTPAEHAAGAPKAVLDIDPSAAPYVCEAFSRLAAGESSRSVARWIANLPDCARGGWLMHARTARANLRNPIYIARQPHGDPDILARSRGHWPALVDDKTWQRAHERRMRHRGVPHQASGRYLLTGLIYCPACGARMQGNQTKGVLRYRCGSHDRGGACAATADARRVEPLVIAEVTNVVQLVTRAEPAFRAAVERAWDALRTPPAVMDAANRITTLQNEAGRARKRIARATELFVDGQLDKAAYDTLCAHERIRLESAEAETIRLEGQERTPELPTLQTVLLAFGGWPAAVQAADIGAQRDLLAQLCSRIVPRRIRRGVYRLEIDWTPIGEGLRAATIRCTSESLAA